MVAEQTFFMWEGMRQAGTLDATERFTIAEFEPGDGALAESILDYLERKAGEDASWRAFADQVLYVCYARACRAVTIYAPSSKHASRLVIPLERCGSSVVHPRSVLAAQRRISTASRHTSDPVNIRAMECNVRPGRYDEHGHFIGGSRPPHAVPTRSRLPKNRGGVGRSARQSHAGRSPHGGALRSSHAAHDATL
jgi:hypothetical protein